MKYDVIYSCGHEGTVELFGKGSERERKLYWYEHEAVCPECYKKQLREKEEKEGLILNLLTRITKINLSNCILTAIHIR